MIEPQLQTEKTQASPAGKEGSMDVKKDPMRSARVLVVEDERHIARFLEFVLRKAGYDVAVANDGEEALEIVERFQPDAMLLDLVMPKLSGLEVLRTLRADKKYAELIIAVLTARSFGEMSAEILTAGANLHCEKPIAPSTLLRQLLDFGVPPMVDQRSRVAFYQEVINEVA
jgi:CheY-like chemotaxis protein